MRSPDPFRYPDVPHARRHGPQGYAHYGQYREWLRDEFGFRCVFCLRRERWTQTKGEFDIDHLLPRSSHPHLITEYDNLVYSCRTCNLDKSSATVPNPHHHAYGHCIAIRDDGTIHALNAEGEILIDQLDLDAPTKNRYRKWILDGVKAAAQSCDHAMLHAFFSLPEDPPRLRLRPPGGNSRPEGLRMSWHARRKRGEVPKIIE
jgi:5-methylcytosine-specific restriction endonuclease McrA